MTFQRFYTQRDITREDIQRSIDKVRNIQTLQEMKETYIDLQRKHLMIIHVIKSMDINSVKSFVNKLTSFIIKWKCMYEESESNSITNIIEYFFSTDFTSFHIIFFIGVNHYIYSSRLDSIFISRQ